MLGHDKVDKLVTSQVALFQKLAFASCSFEIIVRSDIFIAKRFQWTLKFTVCVFYTPNCHFVNYDKVGSVLRSIPPLTCFFFSSNQNDQVHDNDRVT